MNSTRQLFKKLKIQTVKTLLASRSTLACEKHVSVDANVSHDEENLEIKIGDVLERFPLVWLRDNCTCENCYHKPSKSRIINWNDFNIDVKATAVERNGDSEVVVYWDDSHRSVYTQDWLKSRSFTEDGQQQYVNNVYKPKKRLWDKKDFFNVMHTYNYNDIMRDKKLFHDWLSDLAVYGVTLIEGAPIDPNEGRKLADKIAFIRKTHYGEDYHIKAKPGTQNVAYLSSSLQLHTDLPYYHYKPGANLLHCIVQTPSNGGENLLTDVFFVAEKLRSENKEVFDILTGTDINWSDIGEEDGIKFHKIHRAPMIRLDSYGNVAGVRHSIPQRDSHFTVNLNNVRPWYKAMRVFVNSINQHAAEFKLKPGNILGFDNTRLVHGRVGYQDTDENKRFLIGIFLDWDEIYSQLRVLKGELNIMNIPH